MRFLDKLIGRGEPAPDWAAFMKPDEFEEFIGLVEAELESSGRPFELDAQAGVAQLTDGAEGSKLGLLNIAQTCGRIPRREWDDAVHTHFTRLLAVSDAAMNSELGQDFESARSLLKVRLYPADMAGAEMMVTRSPAEGILAALVYDLPESIASVHKDHVARWGVPEDELFKIGLANVRAEIEPQAQSFEADGGATICAATGDSFFTASQALYLEALIGDPVPELGALVAIPHRHMVLFHPIRDASCITAMNTLIPMAHGINQEGPGSISPNVYWWREAAWWHEGQFMLIPSEIRGRTIECSPPAEFITKVLEPFGAK